MDLIRFFISSSQIPKSKLVFHSLLAGITNVLVLALLNSAAQNASNKTAEVILFVLFTINVIIFVLSQKFIWRTSIQEIEHLVHTIRLRLIHKIAGCQLEKIERTGKSELYAAINQHAYTITLSAMPVIISIQSAILIMFTLIYIMTLSLVAFVLTVCFLTAAVYFAVQRSRRAKVRLDVAIHKEKGAYATINDLLEGFKEVKLHDDRQQDLTEFIDYLSEGAKDSRTTANQQMALNYISTQTSFYLMIAFMIFLIPIIGPDTFPEDVIKVTTAAIFIIGPINSIISILPSFTNAQASLHFIQRVDNLLEKSQEGDIGHNVVLPPFEKLTLKDVCYFYQGQDEDPGFQVGPVNLEIKANEIVFFTGGNGSGKTTLLKSLVGLYQIKSGVIEYNGSPIRSDQLRAFRNQFTGIFSDYHLFKRFYGLGNVDPDEAKELLDLLQLEQKTSISEDEFITQNLSTGQRKRLALVVAILEKRPVLILDEWAADQDPTFRAIFYQKILPKLKAQGRTIIAITHDEKYFDCSDQRFHLVEGKISQQHES
ncbi:cyclic peptide export ABC transporter [Algicola sagamiensis]|uniref:cyclic peptide export ABC transporter n=1 Tax=Algicola sagamiensis TaxID=163869 RepID=UPI0003791E75|nr:cyclic peptide export ABC transporter [Algicola sagamiensis]